jgi:hypothetical protein
LQKIIYFFIINLKKWAKELKTSFATFIFFKDCIYWSRYNSCKILILIDLTKICHLLFIRKIFIDKILPITSKHCISFSRTGLSISKYSKVKSLEYFVNIRLKISEDVNLCFFLSNNLIKFALNMANLVMVNFKCFILWKIK